MLLLNIWTSIRIQIIYIQDLWFNHKFCLCVWAGHVAMTMANGHLLISSKKTKYIVNRPLPELHTKYIFCGVCDIQQFLSSLSEHSELS